MQVNNPFHSVWNLSMSLYCFQWKSRKVVCCNQPKAKLLKQEKKPKTSNTKKKKKQNKKTCRESVGGPGPERCWHVVWLFCLSRHQCRQVFPFRKSSEDLWEIKNPDSSNTADNPKSKGKKKDQRSRCKSSGAHPSVLWFAWWPWNVRNPQMTWATEWMTKMKMKKNHSKPEQKVGMFLGIRAWKLRCGDSMVQNSLRALLRWSIMTQGNIMPWSSRQGSR